MLTNYARWYSFTPPQWPTLSPPLTAPTRPGLRPHSLICRLVFLPLRRNRPIHRLLAGTAPTFLLPPLFPVGTHPRLPFWALTQIPVHGYDTESGLRSRSGRPQTGTRHPWTIACCAVADALDMSPHFRGTNMSPTAPQPPRAAPPHPSPFAPRFPPQTPLSRRVVPPTIHRISAFQTGLGPFNKVFTVHVL